MKQILPDLYKNPVLLTDFYNGSHTDLKVNIDWEISHIYNRAQPMVLFGFNWNVLNLLTKKVTMKNINDAEKAFVKMGLPDGMFPRDMWVSVVKDFKGYAPLKVLALPDGSWVPKGTPFAQIKNTEKGFGELVSWWEGVFLHSSFPSGCATRAHHMKQYLVENNYPIWKFHSFGFRGHNSMENAYWAGLAWALFLKGTDDIHIYQYAKDAGLHSIPASAHKVEQQFDNEFDGYIRAIDAVKKKGGKMLSIPIDTYNTTRFIDEMAVRVLAHGVSSNVDIVFRPDSGNVFSQTRHLWDKISATRYFDKFRVIIGEGMNFEKSQEYDAQFKDWGVPVERISYGIGAGFFKDINRDTLGWAMKTAYSNGKDRMKFSDDPIKQSIPGEIILTFVAIDNQFHYEVNPIESLLSTLHHTIYHWSSDIKYKPRISYSSFDEIWVNAQSPINSKQSDIFINDSVTNKIEELRTRYLK